MLQPDDVVWSIINDGFCSYKIKADKSTFCRNENNVTGLCNRQSCPLANSNYATVREFDGECYLYVKDRERGHKPASWWEKIKLDGDTTKAQEQIEEKLQYWSGFVRGTCKERVAKMHEYLKRMKKLRMKNEQPIVSVRKMKAVKRDRNREERAKEVARLESTIERELMERLKQGVYGEIYNLSQKTFDKVLDKKGKAQTLEEEDEEEYKEMMEFVEGESEEEEYEREEELDIEDTLIREESIPKRTRRHGPRVEIEYEEEFEPRSERRSVSCFVNDHA